MHIIFPVWEKGYAVALIADFEKMLKYFKSH